MASDYGLNFGFRRSAETMSRHEGRFKTPAGTAWRIGTAVEIDPAAPGFLKRSAAATEPLPGVHGLLVQEESHLRSIYQTDEWDSFDLGVAKANQLSTMWFGAGVKVWFRNTAGATRIDGRVIPSVAMVVMTGIAVGDALTWNGTAWAKSGDGSNAWFRVTATSTDYVEAVLQF